MLILVTGSTSPAEDSGYDQVKSILKAHCFRCHGVRKQEVDLRLDSGPAILRGSGDGPVVKPGDANNSRLLDRITSRDKSERMPPEGAALTKTEISTILAWIQSGATFPKNDQPESNPADHWAFRSPKRSAIPIHGTNPRVNNPIDAFLAAGHQRSGLQRVPQADPTTLFRRVTLDLTGLPPTPRELKAYLADDRPDRWSRTVDRLLQSPRYGERWGRHWMDVWRYSDWYGYQKQLRNSSRHIWRWRDWIIESLNGDLPYDMMIQQMLAADELPDATAESLRATGFLARNFYLFNRNTWLDLTIEHTGKAFLGLTINCARCHDHMYDPVAQRDYYRFRAIFEPHKIRTDTIDGHTNADQLGLSLAYDAEPKTKTYLFERGNDKRPDKEHPLTASIPSFLPGAPLRVEPVALSPLVYYPGLRPSVREGLRESARQLVTDRQRAVDSLATAAGSANDGIASDSLRVAQKELAAAKVEWDSLNARIDADSARYFGQDEDAAKSAASLAAARDRQARVITAEAAVLRAELVLATAKSTKDKKKLSAATKSLESARKSLASASAEAANTSSNYRPLTKIFPSTSTGRRLALARWITSTDNPLTSRVCVNHVWMRHFGSPLVPSVFDLGNNGRRSRLPELLDWLAVELVERGWDLEHLHRLILTSSAYRMSSNPSLAPAHTRNADPDNLWLWRMNTRRLESELVRDSVLFVCGHLDDRMGGAELAAGLGETTARRSLYYRHAPEKMMVFLDLFDAASTHECYRRDETVVPQQALALVNSRLAIEQSRRLARRLDRTVGADDTVATSQAFLDTAFLRILGRSPRSEERRVCLEFLNQQARLLSRPDGLTRFGKGLKVAIPPAKRPHLRARENLLLVLLNHNEFLTIR